MPTLAGTRLGSYEILAPLGAGGMCEVYRARDPRMGREVAMKLCNERFTDRFEREVRAIAVNHPNICQIYDAGPNYLAMELVDGPTLVNRVERGALAADGDCSPDLQCARGGSRQRDRAPGPDYGSGRIMRLRY